MKNWKAIVGVVAVFVLGALAGSFTTVGVIRHRFHHGQPGQAMADHIVRKLSRDLRLDTAQREQLRAIVNDGRKEMQALRPRIEDILTRSEAKTRAILRPDQQQEFDKLVAERKAKWAQSKDG
jgi:Spy/CpxP family protein refolding chaperone